MDGAATVHFLPTTGVATFNDYICREGFYPYLQMQLQSATRIDAVWDTCLPDSLKESSPEKRGKGVYKKYQVKRNCLVDGWISLCFKEQNRIFTLLADKIVKFKFPPGKLVCHSNWFVILLTVYMYFRIPNCKRSICIIR